MAREHGSAEALNGEILQEAARESHQVLSRAREEAESIAEAASNEAAKIREEGLSRARAEALRRKESILSTVPLEAGRMQIMRIESMLDTVKEEARTRLLTREGISYREAVRELTAIAINQMAGLAFKARVPEADRELLGDGFRQELIDLVGRPDMSIALSFDPAMAGGGVIVEDAEGRQACDNGLVTRLERMWPELRRLVAQEASFVPKEESGGSNQ
jgi:vacuolar-type H+-ATPase subunit E/Vma4